MLFSSDLAAVHPRAVWSDRVSLWLMVLDLRILSWWLMLTSVAFVLG
jgi:hypothetical protein